MTLRYNLTDYTDLFSVQLLAISKSPFTIFDGPVAASLTPLTTLPTVEFKLGFIATSNGIERRLLFLLIKIPEVLTPLIMLLR
jgi:hypothetical protein